MNCKTNEFSLISEQIQELLYSKSLKENETVIQVEEFFVGNSYDWDRIKNFLNINGINPNNNVEIFSYNYCLKCCHLLHPIWKYCKSFATDILIQRISKCALWESHASEILDLLIVKEISETSIVEGILLLTSVIENALGNVYFTFTQQNPPHLLRDLLKTTEIREYFGNFPIYFLQLLLGTPNSVNLRNIVWHGFPNFKEVPGYFYETILITMTSLSEIYQKKPIKIKYREKVKHINIYFNFTEQQFEDLVNDIKNEDAIYKIIENSKYCPKQYEIYWMTVFKYYLKHDYKKFIILILPQIELAFRLIYAELNKFDVSAKIDEYYITMDSIFEYNIPKSSIENQLYGPKFNEKILKLSYDLFISPNGPRIRDKISHGEVDLNYIDQNLCLTILILGLFLLGHRDKSIQNFITNYESQFHINAIFRNNFKISYNRLTEFRNHVYFKEHFLNKIDLEENFQNINQLLCDFQLNIFKRHSEEKKIVGFLNRIIISIKIICENLFESYEAKFKLLNNRQLRSRERKTLQSMIEIYPHLQNTLISMIDSVGVIFLKIHNDLNFVWIDKFCDKIVRFLKFFLKAVENFIQTSSILRNKIDKSDLICQNFNKHLISFRKECELNL